MEPRAKKQNIELAAAAFAILKDCTILKDGASRLAIGSFWDQVATELRSIGADEGLIGTLAIALSTKPESRTEILMSSINAAELLFKERLDDLDASHETEFPQHLVVKKSGHPEIDGLYTLIRKPSQELAARIPETSRGHAAYGMWRETESPTYLYHNKGWRISKVYGAQDGLASIAKDVQGRLCPCEPYPDVWEVVGRDASGSSWTYAKKHAMRVSAGKTDGEEYVCPAEWAVQKGERRPPPGERLSTAEQPEAKVCRVEEEARDEV